MEKITVWGYLKEYAETKDELLKAVTEVFESGTLILGQKGRDFEQAYSDYVGVGYGIGCDNGTNAITLALKALEIGEGDKVELKKDDGEVKVKVENNNKTSLKTIPLWTMMVLNTL